jgi:peptide/nickel transport system substrate-binding protein
MGLNLTSPILKDIRVRRAIAHSIDREGIIKNILRGSATLATGVLPPSHWAYAPDVRAYPYDPGAAKRLLKQANYPLPLHLSYKTSQNELARRVAEAIQHQLSAVGIEVDLRTYEWGTFYADIKSGNFQLYTLSWVGVNDPDFYFNLFHSESFPPAGANRGRYRSPGIDRLLEDGRQTTDTERRAKIYRLVQRQIAEDLPYVSLWHPKNIVVRKRNLEGFVLYPGGDLISLKSIRRVSP